MADINIVIKKNQDEIEECKCDIFGDFLYDNFDTSDLYDILINRKKINFDALKKDWDTYYTKRIHQIIEDDYYPQIVEV